MRCEGGRRRVLGCFSLASSPALLIPFYKPVSGPCRVWSAGKEISKGGLRRGIAVAKFVVDYYAGDQADDLWTFQTLKPVAPLRGFHGFLGDHPSPPVHLPPHPFPSPRPALPSAALGTQQQFISSSLLSRPLALARGHFEKGPSHTMPTPFSPGTSSGPWDAPFAQANTGSTASPTSALCSSPVSLRRWEIHVKLCRRPHQSLFFGLR